MQKETRSEKEIHHIPPHSMSAETNTGKAFFKVSKKAFSMQQ